jgi:SAM-dependent methyltransferase
MPYDPRRTAAYFDAFAEREWQRFDGPLGAVSEHLHKQVIRRFVPRGARVLDIGAGPGRFTEVVHELGCRVVVADISRVQLDLNRRFGAERGFAASVEQYLELDISDLSSLAAESFDAVIAFGGPLSYVFERRDDAMRSCRRVLRPGGVLLASVMNLWGTLHRHLEILRVMRLEDTRDIIATGDLTDENDPTSPHKCHMYRAEEFAALLERHGFRIDVLTASGALSTHQDALLTALRGVPERWQALLDLEEEASARPGLVECGTHLIAAATR